MTAIRAVTLQQLVCRAEKYGTELVWKTAERNLHVDIEDLGRLALHLRRIDPEWKLSKRAIPGVRVSQRDRLVFGLLDAGWPDKRIRAAAGISPTTFRALKAQCLRDEKAQLSGSGQITPDPPKTSVEDVVSWGGNDPLRIVGDAAHGVALSWIITGADVGGASVTSSGRATS